ncbi:MAG: type II toxin-antitoxin system death-on-curing family toxin [Deltaproteobacteria bacterium]|nr:MAG: type II toxin-antitoxin system death-on-curing family toxin [Deltaproteobacteria bacterium]
MIPEFLTVEDIIAIHSLQLRRYGGAPGIRDPALLESAILQPKATIDGEFLHTDLFAMAAAYFFHLVQGHAFVDGNKRAEMLAALVFLDINGIPIEQESETLYELTMAVAEGRAGKEEIAGVLRRIAERP